MAGRRGISKWAPPERWSPYGMGTFGRVGVLSDLARKGSKQADFLFYLNYFI